MAFSLVSRRTVEATLLVSFAVLAVGFAGLMEQQTNETYQDGEILYKGSTSSE